jgi:hypothetical protein
MTVAVNGSLKYEHAFNELVRKLDKRKKAAG